MEKKQPTLSINLLGPLEIKLDNTPIPLRTAKAKALLVYLAVSQQTHSRSQLLALLWGDLPEGKARRNLTATLSELRKSISDYLVDRDNQLLFNFELPHQLDIFQLTAAMEEAQSTQELNGLREAISLYRGDFLAGFSVKNAFEFEEWMLAYSAQCRERMVQALTLLTEAATSSGETARGIDYAQKLLELEPWMETAHRQMIILLAQSGRIDAAIKQYERCKTVLSQELGVEPSSDTQALYAKLKTGDLQIPHNLPPQPNKLVGRTQEIKLAHRNLIDPDCRLLTLVGLGGIGKTRLAVEIARYFVDPQLALTNSKFSDGVWLVPLSEIPQDEATEATLIPALANTLSLQLPAAGDPRPQLLAYLKEKSTLLILDNFEQFLTHPAARSTLSLINRLLNECPSLELLLTSRERLKLQHEWVLPLDGLSYPKNGSIIADDNFDRYGAISLFVQRGQQVSLGFKPQPEELNQIIQLCQLLDGHPLGIELAASWMHFLPISEIVEELEAGLDRLEAAKHDLPDRHRSLHAAIDYSWKLLSAEEQALLKQLAIFRGGFTRDAVRKIIGPSLQLLVRLVDKSLLYHSESGRYNMHQLLRQYVTEQPAGGVDLNRLHESFSHYYAQLAKDAYAKYLTGSYEHSLAEIDADFGNIRSSWLLMIRAIRDQQASETMLALLKQLVDPLDWYFARRALYAEQEFLIESAISVIKHHPHPVGGDAQLNALLKGKLAWLRYFQGAYDIAEQIIIEEVWPTLDPSEIKSIKISTLNTLAQIARRKGNYAKCNALAEESLDLSTKVNDEIGRILALANFAMVAADQGDYPEAEKLGIEIVDFYKKLNDTPRQIRWQSNLANTYFRQNKLAESYELLSQAWVQAAQSTDLFSRLIVQTNMGRVALELGKFELARRHLAESLAQARNLGNQRWTAINLDNFSRLHLAQEAWDQAILTAKEALEICVQTSNEADALGIMVALGEAWLATDETDKAKTLLQYVLKHPSAIKTDKDHSQQLLNTMTSTSEKQLHSEFFPPLKSMYTSIFTADG